MRCWRLINRRPFCDGTPRAACVGGRLDTLKKNKKNKKCNPLWKSLFDRLSKAPRDGPCDSPKSLEVNSQQEFILYFCVFFFFQQVFLSIDSLLLFVSASLAARPFQTPASRGPAGTPPASASRAGTPRSCHTCRRGDTWNTARRMRPLRFTRQAPKTRLQRRSKDMLIRCLFAMIRGLVRRSHRSAGERRRWGAGQLRLSAELHMSLLSA